MALSGAGLSAGSAFAQTAKDIVGTWKTVTNISIAPDGRRTDLFGSNPSAVLVFDASGRFVTVSTRPDLPKFASNNRTQGTAEENKAIVQGSIAYFGTYSVVDKVIIEKVEGSTWPSWIGTDQKRMITSFTGDDLTLANAANSVGGTGETTYKRVK
jgi:Lipocalin-like domain